MATPTNEMSDEMYRSAARALKRIMADPNASESQAAAAEKEFDRLNADYISWATGNVKKRTQAFQEFIDNMEALITKLNKNPGLDGINRLTQVVGAAKAVLNA